MRLPMGDGILGSTISSITYCGIVAFRPRPWATFPNLNSPSTVNLARQARTVIDVTRH
jgi:hypothetical protein